MEFWRECRWTKENLAEGAAKRGWPYKDPLIETKPTIKPIFVLKLKHY